MYHPNHTYEPYWRPLTPSKALPLIKNALDGTPHQYYRRQWKKIHINRVTYEDLGQVGYKYWLNFKKRNADKIVTRKGEKLEFDRYNWTTYHNFAQIFKCFGNEMEYAIVAKN